MSEFDSQDFLTLATEANKVDMSQDFNTSKAKEYKSLALPRRNRTRHYECKISCYIVQISKVLSNSINSSNNSVIETAIH